jgi:hypothetical protein
MYFISSNSNIAGGPFVEESCAYSKLYQLIAEELGISELEFLSSISQNKDFFYINGYTVALTKTAGLIREPQGYSTCYSILQYQSLSKTELEVYLRKDYTMAKLFPDTSKGEDCVIFKDSWEKSDRIIYIPDYGLNGIISNRILNAKEIDRTVHSCYTGNDFLRICKRHENVAQALFAICNWQHPDIQDLLDGFDEDEFLETFGIPMSSLEQEVQA